VFGIIAVLVGVFVPRIPGWYHTGSGAAISLDQVHAVCSSSAALVLSSGSAAAEGRCANVDVYSGILLVVLIAGCVLLLAGVLVATRWRPAVAGRA
jgi:hypothetical protein